MIESIEFKNFKALRDTTLPLSPCTILVGPNGSGKSTVLQALEAVRSQGNVDANRFLSVGVPATNETVVKVTLNLGSPYEGLQYIVQGRCGQVMAREIHPAQEKDVRRAIFGFGRRMRVFSLEADALAGSTQVGGPILLEPDGSRLAAVLDGLRDIAPERFVAINTQLGEWLPEFDCVVFDRPKQGEKSIALRTRVGGHRIPAVDLSQGTLIALGLLTLAYLPEPPSLVGLEEPDRGIHPYLLRHVQDAIYRLSNPEASGEDRDPVQVIATTHSPYFLDLFKDFPEEIVVANKVGGDVQFQQLTDQPHFEDILGDAPLGEAWFTGVLGGVPSES